MKSLIKTPSASPPPSGAQSTAVADEKVAQCCAKVSKAVAGCHD
jgi:hypothetical protein